MYTLLKSLSKLPLRWIQNLAKSIANLLFLSNSSIRRTTEINLKVAYPDLSEEQRLRLAKKSVQSQCMTYAESVKIWGSSPNFALQQIKTVHQLEIFTEALKNPNGCLAVVPHFGTWELMNAWLNQHADPVIMYKPNKNPDIDRFVLESRQSLSSVLVPTDETGVRSIFKHLKSGGFSVILPDHVPNESGGIYSPFYGLNTLSSTLLSKLAAKTQCSVVGLHCLRREDLSGFDLYVTPLSQNINSKDLQRSVDALNKDLESMINTAPEQYIWGYKRFRRLDNKKYIY